MEVSIIGEQSKATREEQDLHRGILLSWHTSPFHDLFMQLDLRISEGKPASFLRSSMIEGIFHTLYHHGDCLEQTIAELTKSSLSTSDQIDMCLLQGGQRALIIFNRVHISGEFHCFVTQVCRQPLGTKLAKKAQEEFDHLRFLEEAFNRLKPAFREKFGVVKPISQGIVQIGSESYPMYTTPFIPYGEFLFAARMNTGNMGINFVPYMKYAIPWTEQMKAWNNKIESFMDSKEFTIAAGAAQVEHMEFVYRPFFDILFANTLIYVLTGKFPTDFRINNGDWTGIVDLNSGTIKKMMFMSIGGDLASIVSDEEWIQRIRQHKEYPVNLDINYEISLFTPIQVDQLKKIIHAARDIITN